jgi:hypothetical protein
MNRASLITALGYTCFAIILRSANRHQKLSHLLVAPWLENLQLLDPHRGRGFESPAVTPAPS